MLIDYLDRENILFDAEAADREEAVRIAGGLLVKCGAAKPSYVDAMVDMSKDFHYIVLAPGLAMPHARTECGALGNSLSVVKLKKPVPFGHPQHDPVSVVLGLVARSESEHLDVMEALADVLGEEGNIERMTGAKSVEELIAVLS